MAAIREQPVRVKRRTVSLIVFPIAQANSLRPRVQLARQRGRAPLLPNTMVTITTGRHCCARTKLILTLLFNVLFKTCVHSFAQHH